MPSRPHTGREGLGEGLVRGVWTSQSPLPPGPLCGAEISQEASGSPMQGRDDPTARAAGPRQGI